MARRRKKHEEHENHERWLVSYADFITLLFAFFVVMYSVSAVNEGKFRVLSEALAAAFRSAPKSLEPIQMGRPAKSPYIPNSKIPTKAQASAIIMASRTPIDVPKATELPKSDIEVDNAKGERSAGDRGERFPDSELTEPAARGSGRAAALSAAAIDQAAEGIMRGMSRMADEIEASMSELIKDDLVLVRRDKNRLWIEVEIKSNILFSSGSADLAPEAVPLLWKIARILRKSGNPIQVEGFTDDVPISTAVFPSNWELSAARAASVVHLFMDAGVTPDRMMAVGYGEHRPIVDNATEDGRRRNRRVVLVVLADTDAGRVLDMKRRQAEERAADGTVARADAPAGGAL